MTQGNNFGKFSQLPVLFPSGMERLAYILFLFIWIPETVQGMFQFCKKTSRISDKPYLNVYSQNNEDVFIHFIYGVIKI